MKILTWDEKLNFYAKYHKNPTNILLHLIAMPNIIWTFCLFLSYIPTPIFNNLSYFVYFNYVYYYYNSDKIIGKKMGIFLGILLLWSKLYMLLITHHFRNALFVNLISWGLQFAGHKYFEKNSPALKDSIIEAFTIAPVFCLKHLEPYLESFNKKYNVVEKFGRLHKALFIFEKFKQTAYSIDENKTKNKAEAEAETNSDKFTTETTETTETAETETTETTEDKKNN